MTSAEIGRALVLLMLFLSCQIVLAQTNMFMGGDGETGAPLGTVFMIQ